MTTFSEAASAIRNAFWSDVSGWSPTYQVAWPNVDFTPPSDEPWVSLTIREGEAQLAGYGGSANLYRHPGVVMVQVFTLRNTGDGLARQIADDVAAIFRGKRLDGVRFFNAPHVHDQGPDGHWYQFNVTAPFEYDLLA